MTGSGVGWRAAAVVLFLLAAALAVLAFSRFGAVEPPAPGSPGVEEYEDGQVRRAQLSVGLGLAAAFALLGGFACWQRGGRRSEAAPSPPGPPQT